MNNDERGMRLLIAYSIACPECGAAPYENCKSTLRYSCVEGVPFPKDVVHVVRRGAGDPIKERYDASKRVRK